MIVMLMIMMIMMMQKKSEKERILELLPQSQEVFSMIPFCPVPKAQFNPLENKNKNL